MPYQFVEDLPASVRNSIPYHAQQIYKGAFNHAFKEYGDKDLAFRAAWSAVKKSYEKDAGGIWKRKQT